MSKPKSEPARFMVLWDDMSRDRRFRTFVAAEKFARRLVASGDGKPRDVEITRDGLTVATIDADALDRVWTDMREVA